MVRLEVHRVVVIGLVALLTSYCGVLAIRRWAFRVGLVDVPNQRSLHSAPTPRAGGLSFVVTVLLGVVLLRQLGWIAWPPSIHALWLGASLVAVVSLIDDRWNLPTTVRLVAQAAAALTLVSGGGLLLSADLGSGTWTLGVFSVPVTLLWVIGLTNAYNFMDGIDGLAAGQAVVTALTMGWLAWLREDYELVPVMVLLGAAVLAFLPHNWWPARIFMGDVGSAFLGFVFAAWSVVGSVQGTNHPPPLAWVAVLSPFVFDTATTLARRIVRRERVLEAHCQHYYQRLVAMGWPHARVTCLYLGGSVFSGGVAVVVYGYASLPPALLLLTCVPVAFIHFLVKSTEHGNSLVIENGR